MSGWPRVYAKASLFAFPTLGRNGGVVVNEAMAVGLPVLGSIYSQAVAVVEDGASGRVFRPMNREEVDAVLDRATPWGGGPGTHGYCRARGGAVPDPEFAADRMVGVPPAANR